MVRNILNVIMTHIMVNIQQKMKFLFSKAFPNSKLVIILVGTYEEKVFQEIAEGLCDVSKQKKIYVVASSDMLYHANHQLVEKTDRETIALTEKMDVNGLLKKWNYDNQIYCVITAVIPTMI